jgi:hypothetical protein
MITIRGQFPSLAYGSGYGPEKRKHIFATTPKETVSEHRETLVGVKHAIASWNKASHEYEQSHGNDAMCRIWAEREGANINLERLEVMACDMEIEARHR